MGITSGEKIEVSNMPLGDPIEIVVKDYKLAIRKNDAKYNYIEGGGQMIKIAFAGNHVGKTALINSIAGSKLRVGNWPGVTVEKKKGRVYTCGEKIQLIDLREFTALLLIQ